MVSERNKYSSGRLTAGSTTYKGTSNYKQGEHLLGLDTKKDGLIYVPESYTDEKPAALAMMLHGAGAPARQGLSLLRNYAEEKNIILLAPASRSYTWDIIAANAFGPDVIYIDQALALVLENFAIDKTKVAIGGFSDGASYAFCLGLTNGDLFTHIIAFSPGFAAAKERHGKPAIFVSHGVHDTVLPIEPCSRRVVRQLKQQGMQVNYQEFDGAHEIPGSISKSAANWFTGTAKQAQEFREN